MRREPRLVYGVAARVVDPEECFGVEIDQGDGEVCALCVWLSLLLLLQHCCIDWYTETCERPYG